MHRDHAHQLYNVVICTECTYNLWYGHDAPILPVSCYSKGIEFTSLTPIREGHVKECEGMLKGTEGLQRGL